MPTDVEDWRLVDEWWGGLGDSVPLPLITRSMPQIDESLLDGHWDAIDSWWPTYSKTRTLGEVSRIPVVPDDEFYGDAWSELDPWWLSYLDAQRESLREFLDEVERVSQHWERGSPFSEDPLGTNWRTNARRTGPLRINQEENWSQWLAHLIRSAPEPFLEELFGPDVRGEVDSVKREVHLRDRDAKDRYADILVFLGGDGLSIEVKKGDENYGKTIHTASLVEDAYPRRSWHHVLLAPEVKLPVVRESFGEVQPANNDDRPLIQSSVAEDITVQCWKDVSGALRMALLEDVDTDSHWESSAFLFCTLIEQKILGFTPIPVAERLVESSDVVRSSESVVHTGTELEEQIAYLRNTMLSADHE